MTVRRKRSAGHFLSPKNVAKRLLAQRAAAAASRAKRAREEKVRTARELFKPRKADRGKIIFVGTKGERNPTKKGRKGFPIYVTKTGKKWVIKQHGGKPISPRTISQLVLPDSRNLRRATKKFQSARLIKVGRIRTVRKESASVKTGGRNDFTEQVSNTIAASIRKTLEAQRAQRIFIIKFIALVRLPNGQTEVISGDVPIDRPDHIHIKLAGIRNFVRQKFYAFMARELAFAGYVSNGSANHIRRLGANRGKPRDKWVNRRGEPWAGRNKQQVEIIKIDWTIEQAK